MTELQKRLYESQDIEYRDFTIKLNPTVDPDTVIGVRLPELRSIAKGLGKSGKAREFMSELPHRYLEENHIHSFAVGNIKDFDEAIREAERFLPYIDNWAVCDSMRIKALGKNPEKLNPYIAQWLKSGQTYTVRFAILNLMNLFLDDGFDEKYPAMVASVKSEEYYVNMMIAWYFATALAKQYDSAIKYIEGKKLSKWTHNKTIRKAIESFRVTAEHKEYLRKLRIK